MEIAGKEQKEVSGGLLKMQKRGDSGLQRRYEERSFDLIKTYENDTLHKPKTLQTLEGIWGLK